MRHYIEGDEGAVDSGGGADLDDTTEQSYAEMDIPMHEQV